MNFNSSVGPLQIILSSFALTSALMAGQAAADSISGRVMGGGAPIANSTVTLWAATTGAPAELGQAKTGADGQFSLSAATAPATAASLYLVAQGGKATADKSGTENSAIVLMTVLGSKAPARVDLTRFCGHFMFTKRGNQDVQEIQAIHTGVPAPDGPAAPHGTGV